MRERETGFNRQDADWTRGRELALADAESIARRQAGMARRVFMAAAVNGDSAND